MAKKEKFATHRRETGGVGTRTSCGMPLREVKGKVNDTWAGVKCLRCLKVKEAAAKAKAAKKAAKKGRKS